LRNEAHVEYHETADTLLKNHTPETLEIVGLYEPYKEALNAEVSVLDIIRKSEYTSDIMEQDHIRDSIVHGFTSLIKSSLNHYDAAKQNAASRVNTVVKHYGNLSEKTLDEETAAIDDMVRELSDNYAAEVSVLALSEWIDHLQLENNTFKGLMSARYFESAQRPSGRMRTSRIETDRTYRAILDRIEALVEVNGIATHEAFIRELNAVSERYKNRLSNDAGRRRANDTETAE
jgi:hypothetical protein